MLELTFTFSAGCCYWDACLWHCIGNCNANATIWPKKFETAWYMEMAIVWVCSVLWSFWCVYKLEVSFALQNVTVQEDCWWICIDFWVLLRYLSCIMEVATPTEDCLLLIQELFYPVISRQQEITLSRQEVWYWLSNDYFFSPVEVSFLILVFVSKLDAEKNNAWCSRSSGATSGFGVWKLQVSRRDIIIWYCSKFNFNCRRSIPSISSSCEAIYSSAWRAFVGNTKSTSSLFPGIRHTDRLYFGNPITPIPTKVADEEGFNQVYLGK